MVGVGEKGSDSILARISIVNQFGNCVYDKFVKPTEEVVDYRTWVRLESISILNVLMSIGIVFLSSSIVNLLEFVFLLVSCSSNSSSIGIIMV